MQKYVNICATGDGHRSLVTPERVLSEYNKDLIFLILSLPLSG